VRARFSAVVKKEMPFLLKTFHPNFHAIQYNTAPGEASDKLEDDMWRTCKEFAVSNLKIVAIKEDAERPGEWTADLQYITENLRAPELDGNGNKRRLVRMEQDRFVKDEQGKGFWQLADYKLADVPLAMMQAAERAKQEKKSQEEAEAGAAA
jgi:hypothetical protein